jgi:hypothetical protein
MVASTDLGGSTMRWYPPGGQAKAITRDRLLSQRLVRLRRRGPALMIFFTYQSGPRRSELRTVVLTTAAWIDHHLTDTKQTVDRRACRGITIYGWSIRRPSRLDTSLEPYLRQDRRAEVMGKLKENARRAGVLVGDRLLDLNGLLATELRDLLACWEELAEFFPGVRLVVVSVTPAAGC